MARGIAADFERVAPDTGDGAHGFRDVKRAVAVNAQRGGIEPDRRGVRPAALTARTFRLVGRQDARRVIETERRGRTQLEVGVGDDVAGVVGLDERTAQTPEREGTEGFDGGGRERAADIIIRPQVDEGGTRVILVLQERDRASAGAAGDVIQLRAGVDRAHLDVSEVTQIQIREDVRGAADAAEVELAPTAAEAVGIARAYAEAGAVINTHRVQGVARAAQPRGAVPDLPEVEVLGVDGVDAHDDRARITSETSGAGGGRINRGVEILRATHATDAEIEGGEREVAGELDHRERV